MRRVWMVVLLAAVVFGMMPELDQARAQASKQEVVFVDLESVFTNFYKTKLANKQLQEQAEDFRLERRVLLEDYQSLQEEYKTLRDKALNDALAKDVRAEMRRESEEKLIEVKDQESKLRRFEETSRTKFEDYELRMRKRLVDEIREKIDEYVQAEGYLAVLDSSGISANGVPILLYVDVSRDITDKIHSLLNK